MTRIFDISVSYLLVHSYLTLFTVSCITIVTHRVGCFTSETTQHARQFFAIAHCEVLGLNIRRSSTVIGSYSPIRVTIPSNCRLMYFGKIHSDIYFLMESIYYICPKHITMYTRFRQQKMTHFLQVLTDAGEDRLVSNRCR